MGTDLPFVNVYNFNHYFSAFNCLIKYCIVVNRVRLDMCNLNIQNTVFWRKPNKDICYIFFLMGVQIILLGGGGIILTFKDTILAFSEPKWAELLFSGPNLICQNNEHDQTNLDQDIRGSQNNPQTQQTLCHTRHLQNTFW